MCRRNKWGPSSLLPPAGEAHLVVQGQGEVGVQLYDQVVLEEQDCHPVAGGAWYLEEPDYDLDDPGLVQGQGGSHGQPAGQGKTG